MMQTKDIAAKPSRIRMTIRDFAEYALFLALLPILIVVLIVTYEPEVKDD